MWDDEADVIVVGFGGAGATAAISACDAGARVLIIEKSPEGGGNTKYSSGSMRTYLDADKAIDYTEALCDGTTGRDVLEAFVRESMHNPEWLKEMGAEIGARTRGGSIGTSDPPTYPFIKGSEGIGPRLRVKGPAEAAGIDLWGVLMRNVEKRGIKVMYSTPAQHLCEEKGVGVTGVIASDGKKEHKIRAKRGVVLTSGGFEFDRAMHLDYFGQSYFGLGHPDNTGDGVRMAAEIGADLWHMNAAATGMGFKFPEFPFGIRQLVPANGYIYLDQTGKRFMDEPGTDTHLIWAPTSYIDTKTLQRPRMPCYLIFDEDTRVRGPIGVTGRGKASDLYHWSADNSAEVRKGWIKASDSIAGLAEQIGVRPSRLQKTISEYNLQCVGGYDPLFGRPADTLVPLGRSPYYAAEMWPCIVNTQGGPRRNAKAEVLDVWKKPIRRLYSAGELGSLWHRNYPGAGNLNEALAFGRIAGKNAAGEQPIKA